MTLPLLAERRVIFPLPARATDTPAPWNSLSIWRLNRRIQRLRATEHRPALLPAPGAIALQIGPGLRLHHPPETAGGLHWTSPKGRLIEVEGMAEGAFLGLHLALPLRRLDRIAWLGLVLRGAAGSGMRLQPCLRSGLPGGDYRDSFFPKALHLPGPATDGMALFCPALAPDLPARSPWRELVLFLPVRQEIRLSLHDLRVIIA